MRAKDYTQSTLLLTVSECITSSDICGVFKMGKTPARELFSFCMGLFEEPPTSVPMWPRAASKLRLVLSE